MTTVKNIYDYINFIAPFDTQEDWDNSGFLIGSFRQEVTKCVVALDVTRETAEFAAEQGAQLIVSHHPVVFSPMKKITDEHLQYQLIRDGISVVSAHTNFDKARGGINTALAECLELENTAYLECGAVIGALKTSMVCEAFAAFVKQRLGCGALRYSDTDRPISKVAVCGGSCTELIKLLPPCDAFVTGDASYHALLDADQERFCLVSAGHFETENPGVIKLLKYLSEIFTDVEFLNPHQKNPVKVV